MENSTINNFIVGGGTVDSLSPITRQKWAEAAASFAAYDTYVWNAEQPPPPNDLSHFIEAGKALSPPPGSDHLRYILEANKQPAPIQAFVDNVRPHVSIEATPPPKPKPKPTKVETVWGEKLGKKFTAISAFFLGNYHRLGPEGGTGLNSSEAMFLVHMFSYKWDARSPFPSLGTIATRMGLGLRAVRKIVSRLEALGFIRREYHPTGGCNRYHLDGLFAALEDLMAKDATASAETEAA